MNLKGKLLKAAAILNYVFCALYFVLAASFFALSNNLYWMFLVFALVSLYDGFVIKSVQDKMTNVVLDKRENTKLLAAWIISIVCPPSFVLCAIAYFRSKDDVEKPKSDESRSDGETKPSKQESAAQSEPLNKKQKLVAFCKKPVFIVMCSALVAVFLFGFVAMCFDTSGFSVKVTDFTLTREMTLSYNEGKIHGKEYVIQEETDVDGQTHVGEYAVTMYVPNTATEDNPAPVVFVLPGFTRTKATMAQYCIELSRRGAVVFCSDPGGQGATTANSTSGANGIEYLVQYVYNNTDDFKFCDKNRFGAVGHSAGGGNVITLASDMAGESYEDSIIKAVYNSGYIKTSAANKFAKLHCNAAMSYAYYDEGAFRYQTDTTAFEVISLRFINEVAGTSNNYASLEVDKDYGDMSNGTYRVVHRELINHCFEMYDQVSIANTVDFFNSALNMGSSKDGMSQIWFGKEFFNGLALAAAFTFIIALCGVLTNTPFFATLKNGGKVKQADLQMGEGASLQENVVVNDVLPDSALAQHKTVAHKVIFWSCMLLTAVIACLDYIPLANLSIEIFPTSNLASVFTFVFPARMVNAILLWALINGAIGLAIFFATTAIENLYEYVMYKAKGVTPNYDWSKFSAIKIRGNGWKNVLFNVLKTLLLPLIMFGSFYFLVQLSYWCFHQDFRFMLISAAPLNARMFVTALEYMPIIFVFYISNSIRVNCSIGREGWKEWKVMLVGALANSLGLAFILLINYVCYFATGAPYYGYWGNNNEVWLYVNMVFALVVMMFILPIFNRLFYKYTGNVWVGAITCCMIFIMMTISASVSYIPLY